MDTVTKRGGTCASLGPLISLHSCSVQEASSSVLLVTRILEQTCSPSLISPRSRLGTLIDSLGP